MYVDFTRLTDNGTQFWVVELLILSNAWRLLGKVTVPSRWNGSSPMGDFQKKKQGYTFHNEDRYVEPDIVCTAVSSSECVHAVIGKNTDQMILLPYHTKNNGFKLYYLSDGQYAIPISWKYSCLHLDITVGGEI